MTCVHNYSFTATVTTLQPRQVPSSLVSPAALPFLQIPCVSRRSPQKYSLRVQVMLQMSPRKTKQCHACCDAKCQRCLAAPAVASHHSDVKLSASHHSMGAVAATTTLLQMPTE